jgi:hypothetical protein
MAYSDTPMKVQWITVGGQQIPAFRPQYWDEELEDWRVSSRLYPLPVADKDVLEQMQALNAQQEEIDAKMQQLVAGQSTVNVENFPEVQDVSDAAVLSAVQELRQENAEIKAGQSEILERLNQPIDTQLTGSIEELYHSAVENVTITPGSSYKIVDDQNREDIKEIRGIIRWAFSSMRNWRFTINYVRNNGQLQIVRTTHSIDFESQEALIKPMPLLTNKWNLEITNLSDEEEVYQRATIIGVK